MMDSMSMSLGSRRAVGVIPGWGRILCRIGLLLTVRLLDRLKVWSRFDVWFSV